MNSAAKHDHDEADRPFKMNRPTKLHGRFLHLCRTGADRAAKQAAFDAALESYQESK
jgi:hypothetical protein